MLAGVPNVERSGRFVGISAGLVLARQESHVLRGTLTPDWGRMHWIRTPGGTWHQIIPAIFAPVADGGLATMAGSGSSRTLSNFVMGGTGTLIANAFAYHTSTIRTVNSAVFNTSEAMALGRHHGEDVGDAYSTNLLYLHGASITTADIVVTFNNSATNSGIAAYWVTELVAQAPEATGGGYDEPSVTVNTVTVTDNAFIAVAASGAGSSGEPTTTAPSVRVVGAITGDKVVAAGYRIAGAAGPTATEWETDDSVQVATCAFEVGGGVVNVTVTPTGVVGTGAVGSPNITTSASVPVTGVSGTGAVGSPTVDVAVVVPVTGVSGTGAAGDPAITASADVAVTGVEATGAAGNVSAFGGIIVIPPGVAATTFIGTLSFQGVTEDPGARQAPAITSPHVARLLSRGNKRRGAYTPRGPYVTGDAFDKMKR